MDTLGKNEFATFDRYAAIWQEALQKEIILVPNSTIVLIRDPCSGRH